MTRRSDNYELKKRLNNAALKNRLAARVCVVQEDEAGRTNRRMRRHGEAAGRCRRCEVRVGSDDGTGRGGG